MAAVRNWTKWVRRRPRTVFAAGLLLLLLGAAAGWYGWTASQLRAAEQALEAHDYEAARQHLARCLGVRPGWGRAHFLAARAARCSRRYDEAEEHLKACDRLGYDAPAVTVERLLARVQLGDSAPEAYLRERVARDDANALAILEVLTQRYLDSYQLMRALDSLNCYLRQRPHDLQALLGRAYVYERLLYFAKAGDDYRAAVTAHPDSDQARLRLAKTLLIAGTPAEALQHFEDLRRRRPADPDVLLGLARSRRRLGSAAAAREILDALLAQHPDRVDVLTERGELALDEGDVAAAESWLRRAVRLAPYDQTATTQLRQALKKQGKQAEARKCEDRLRQIQADLKRLDAISKAVMTAPNDAALRCEGGILFLRSGEAAEGVRWLETAVRLAPGYRAAHEALADYYRGTGHPDLAARHARLAAPAGGTVRPLGSGGPP